MVNRGRATAADVRGLMGRGRQAVQAATGILLVSEVKMWGDFDA
jgi:UDP-N-acetylenolpyruvoylglucosamine reductase